jgi:hypothetical protein
VAFAAKASGVGFPVRESFGKILRALAQLAKARSLPHWNENPSAPAHQEFASLLDLHGWLTSVGADSESYSDETTTTLAGNLADIADLDYLTPSDRCSVFILLKFFLSEESLRGTGDVRSTVLRSGWMEAYEAFSKREIQLLRNLSVVLRK